MESKIHCDILTPGPFSGLPEKPAEQASIVTQSENATQPNVSHFRVHVAVFSMYI